MSLQQMVFVTHKYLNLIIKPLNFRKRILKSRDKEILFPSVPMKHCSLCKYTSIKFFKHRGNSVIKPHISNSLDIFYIEHIRKLMF